MSSFCTKCGNEITQPGGRFCSFCGGELPEQGAGESSDGAVEEAADTGEPTEAAGESFQDTVVMPAAEEASEGDTTIMPAVADISEGDTAVMPQQHQPSEGETVKMPAVGDAAAEGAGEQSGLAGGATGEAGGTGGSEGPPTTVMTPPPEGPLSGSYPWKLILLIGAACVILAVGAGAALAFVTKADDKTSTSSTTSTTSTSSTKTSTKSKTTTTKTSTTSTTPTSSTSSKRETKAYISAMDDLIAQNSLLEKKIGIAADQINRAGSSGITDAMLADVDILSIEFLGINVEAQDLEVPSAFSQAHRDFLQLTSYNMDRCNSLYAGALNWQAGQPYQQDFAEGQSAKASYDGLYPFFEDEYAAAQAPLR